MKKFCITLIMFFACMSLNACSNGSPEKPVNLSNIIARYEKNKFLGNLTYRYRTVYISGEIKSMDPFDYLTDGKSSSIDHVVEIGDRMNNSLKGNAYCSFDDGNKDKILQHKNGDVIVFKGTITGYVLNLFMAECEVIEKE